MIPIHVILDQIRDGLSGDLGGVAVWVRGKDIGVRVRNTRCLAFGRELVVEEVIVDLINVVPVPAVREFVMRPAMVL